jgi:fumarylacetoacetase
MPATSWVDIPAGSHFSLANIPFGIISTRSNESQVPRPAVAIGEHVLDLKEFANQGGFDSLPSARQHLNVFSEPTLNAFAALGRSFHKKVREYLQDLLSSDTIYPERLKNKLAVQKRALIHQKDVIMHLPMAIGDYTDFYAGKNHAYNVSPLPKQNSYL